MLPVDSDARNVHFNNENTQIVRLCNFPVINKVENTHIEKVKPIYDRDTQKKQNILIAKHENIVFPKRAKTKESTFLYGGLINSLAINQRRWSLSDATSSLPSVKYSGYYLIPELSEKEKKIITLSEANCFMSYNINNEMRESLIPIKTIYGGLFENYYSPFIWYLSNNFKYDIYENKEKVYLSEIVRAQYEKASLIGRFKGQLPSIICRRAIANTKNLNFLNEHKDYFMFGYSYDQEKIIEEFFKIPGNGASTKRICDTFNLMALGISMNECSIYIHVKPKEEKKVMV